MRPIGGWGGGECGRARRGGCDGDGERSEQRSARRRVGAKGRLSGDLSASLVACWPSMPDERAQRRRAASRWCARPLPATTRRAAPANGRPLNARFSSSVARWPSLTTSFPVDTTANPWLQIVNDLNDFRSPKYQLQMLFNHLVLNRNIDGVISCPTLAVSRPVDQILRKIS